VYTQCVVLCKCLFVFSCQRVECQHSSRSVRSSRRDLMPAKGKTPTQRTLAELRNSGYLPWVVEHWNHYAKVRQDLLGCIDILAFRKGYVLGIQATSGGNVAARIAKAKAEPRLKTFLESGCWFEVWGWRRLADGWNVRRVPIYLEELP